MAAMRYWQTTRSLLLFCCVLIVPALPNPTPATATSGPGEGPEPEPDLCEEKRKASVYCFDERASLIESRCGPQAVQAWLDEYNRVNSDNIHRNQLADFLVRTNKSEYTVAQSAWVEKNVTTWRHRKAFEASRFPINVNIYNASIVAQLRLVMLQAGSASCDPDVTRRRIALDGKISLLLDVPYCPAQAQAQEQTQTQTCDDRQAYFSKELDRRNSWDKLQKAWVDFYDGFSAIRQPYAERTRLLNQGARENNFRDYGHFEWYSDVRDDQFVQQMVDQMSQLTPFYEQIHAYVRHILVQEYPGMLDPRGPLPMHILRNLWAQSWQALFPIVSPFKTHASPDLMSMKLKDLKDQQLQQDQQFRAKWLFQQAERFFISLGLFNMTPTFWEKSMFERPNDNRSVSCQAAAMDFAKDDDYRIVMCTEPSFTHLITAHHEMGHIQYFMAYRHQPTVFQTSATSGFHEAIGDTIGLSVSTQEYLMKLGLLDQMDTSRQYDINFLMRTALDRVVFLPFAFTMDYWRWKVFSGEIGEGEYNRKWWELRLQFGGVVPPVNRDNETFFDPAAKYHLAMNVPYIRYFTARLLQFQFYKAMCNAAGHTGPLHRCDFYGSKEAGQKLKELMTVGASVEWQDALERMTGERQISAQALLEYFEPLRSWLAEYIRQNRVPVGWSHATSAACSTAIARLPNCALMFVVRLLPVLTLLACKLSRHYLAVL